MGITCFLGTWHVFSSLFLNWKTEPLDWYKKWIIALTSALPNQHLSAPMWPHLSLPSVSHRPTSGSIMWLSSKSALSRLDCLFYFKQQIVSLSLLQTWPKSAASGGITAAWRIQSFSGFSQPEQQNEVWIGLLLISCTLRSFTNDQLLWFIC